MRLLPNRILYAKSAELSGLRSDFRYALIGMNDFGEYPGEILFKDILQNMCETFRVKAESK